MVHKSGGCDRASVNPGTRMRSRTVKVAGGGSLLAGLMIGSQVLTAKLASAQVLCLTKSGGFGTCPNGNPTTHSNQLPFTVPAHGPTRHVVASGIALVPNLSVFGFTAVGLALLATMVVVGYARGRLAGGPPHAAHGSGWRPTVGASRNNSTMHARQRSESNSSDYSVVPKHK